MSFEQYQVENAPPWLRGPNGVVWNSSLGMVKDEYLARAKAAVKARWPKTAPADALDLIGENVQIDRGFSPDDASFVALLERAWDLWGEAGRKAGLALALQLGGITNFEIWENWQWAGAEIHPERWWQFWITIRAPFPWANTSLADGTWGDAGTWADGGHWADACPREAYLRLQALVRKWKPSHAHCVNIVLVQQGYAFGDLGGMTWAEAATAGITWTGNTVVFLDA